MQKRHTMRNISDFQKMTKNGKKKIFFLKKIKITA